MTALKLNQNIRVLEEFYISKGVHLDLDRGTKNLTFAAQ